VIDRLLLSNGCLSKLVHEHRIRRVSNSRRGVLSDIVKRGLCRSFAVAKVARIRALVPRLQPRTDILSVRLSTQVGGRASFRCRCKSSARQTCRRSLTASPSVQS
jgi:hypothetical protein